MSEEERTAIKELKYLYNMLQCWPGATGCDYRKAVRTAIEKLQQPPRVKGRWEKQYRSGAKVTNGFVSSCCDMYNERKSNFCPHCGADMRGMKK